MWVIAEGTAHLKMIRTLSPELNSLEDGVT